MSIKLFRNGFRFIGTDMRSVIIGPKGYIVICRCGKNFGDICGNGCDKILCTLCKKARPCSKWFNSPWIKNTTNLRIDIFYRQYTRQKKITAPHAVCKKDNKTGRYILQLSCHT